MTESPFFAPACEPTTDPLRPGPNRATLVGWRSLPPGAVGGARVTGYDGEGTEGERLEWVFEVGRHRIRRPYLTPRALTPDPRNPLLQVLRALCGHWELYTTLQATDPNSLVGREVKLTLIPNDHGLSPMIATVWHPALFAPMNTPPAGLATDPPARKPEARRYFSPDAERHQRERQAEAEQRFLREREILRRAK